MNVTYYMLGKKSCTIIKITNIDTMKEKIRVVSVFMI